MKSFIVLFGIIAFVAFSVCNPQNPKKERTEEEKKTFKEWAATHKKAYKTMAEELAAMEIVLAYAEKVEAHNKLYDEGKVKYRQKLWEHCDMSPEERKMNLYGVNIPESEKMNMRSKRGVQSNSDYPTGPAAIDWREKGLVGEVENQKQCGSCWAFQAAQIVDAFARKKNIVTMTSPQQLVDCNTDNNGCHGGWPPHALDYAVANGMTDMKDYPYIQDQQKCKYDKSAKVVQPTQSITVQTRGNETFMRDVVASVGPVGILFCVEETFENYSEGVYVPPNPKQCCGTDMLGNHAPIVVGYGTDPKGGDYWLVKNSWGTSWGLEGYAKVARDMDSVCNIGYYAMYAN